MAGLLCAHVCCQYIYMHIVTNTANIHDCSILVAICNCVVVYCTGVLDKHCTTVHVATQRTS